MSKIEDLIGETIVQIVQVDDDQLYFIINEDKCLLQTDWSSSWIESIDGDMQDLIGTPILIAEEVKSIDREEKNLHWTFYKLATAKGYVTIRWLDVYNQWYSAEVSIYCGSKKYLEDLHLDQRKKSRIWK